MVYYDLINLLETVVLFFYIFKANLESSALHSWLNSLKTLILQTFEKQAGSEYVISAEAREWH